MGLAGSTMAQFHLYGSYGAGRKVGGGDADAAAGKSHLRGNVFCANGAVCTKRCCVWWGGCCLLVQILERVRQVRQES